MQRHNLNRKKKFDSDFLFFPLNNQLTFFLNLKLFTEYTASLHSSKGLCVMAILRYAFCVMNVCVMLCCVMPFCVMPLRYSSLR